MKMCNKTGHIKFKCRCVELSSRQILGYCYALLKRGTQVE